jgi:hypothetical protein
MHGQLQARLWRESCKFTRGAVRSSGFGWVRVEAGTTNRTTNYWRLRAIFWAFSLIQGSSGVFDSLNPGGSDLDLTWRADSVRSFSRSPSSGSPQLLQPEMPRAAAKSSAANHCPGRCALQRQEDRKVMDRLVDRFSNGSDAGAEFRKTGRASPGQLRLRVAFFVAGRSRELMVDAAIVGFLACFGFPYTSSGRFLI